MRFVCRIQFGRVCATQMESRTIVGPNAVVISGRYRNIQYIKSRLGLENRRLLGKSSINNHMRFVCRIQFGRVCATQMESRTIVGPNAVVISGRYRNIHISNRDTRLTLTVMRVKSPFTTLVHLLVISSSAWWVLLNHRIGP